MARCWFAAVLVAVACVVAGGPRTHVTDRLLSLLPGPLAPGQTSVRGQVGGLRGQASAGRGSQVGSPLSQLLRCIRSRRASPVDATVPAALDVLAACLSSGAAVEHALLAVAAAFDGEPGRLLHGAARLLALGAPVESAWSAALDDPQWAPVARSIVRAHHSGAPLTDVLSRAAEERRRALRAQAHAAANKASVRVVLPLGICFLPAFVLVGVVPVVAGFAAALWG